MDVLHVIGHLAGARSVMMRSLSYGELGHGRRATGRRRTLGDWLARSRRRPLLRPGRCCCATSPALTDTLSIGDHPLLRLAIAPVTAAAEDGLAGTGIAQPLRHGT